MTQDVDERPHCERDNDVDDCEIEITEEMIEAGMTEYGARWRGLRDADDDVARDMLVAAYRAMHRLRPLFVRGSQ